MRKIKLIILLGFVVLYTNSLCQAQDNTKEIDQLENRIEILEKRSELLNERFQTKSESLDLKFQKEAAQLNEDHTILKWLLILFGSVSIFGFMIGYYRILNKAEKIAEEKIEMKLSQFFEEKKENFKSLIDQQVEENKLKLNSHIQVLTPKDDDQQFAKNFFVEMGFKHVEYDTVGASLNIGSVPDLVFINDEECKVDEVTIKKYIDELPREVVFFYFGKGKIDLRHDRLAYANSRLQVYGNLMNALTYQSLLD